MSNQNKNNDIKKCGKCNIDDINWDSWVHLDGPLSFPCSRYQHCLDCANRRLLKKDGKFFCFDCLVSECSVNCWVCHKRINSKNELFCRCGCSFEIDDFVPRFDTYSFKCLGCKDVWPDTRIHKGYNNNKCRIAGCSQKAYYECMDLCLPHSKPCQGGKIKPNGEKCSTAMGVDEGDICEFCQNQIGTLTNNKRIGLETKGNREISDNHKIENNNDSQLARSNPATVNNTSQSQPSDSNFPPNQISNQLGKENQEQQPNSFLNNNNGEQNETNQINSDQNSNRQSENPNIFHSSNNFLNSQSPQKPFENNFPVDKVVIFGIIVGGIIVLSGIFLFRVRLAKKKKI